MIVVIGNGRSRSVFNLNQLENHVTYGCNAVYRDYSPTYLVCGDHPMTWDICFSGYSRQNKCYFKTFDKIPSFNFEMVKSMYPPGFRILQTTPSSNEFVTFQINKNDIGIYWVGEEEKTQKIEWWGEPDIDGEYSYTSGCAAMKLACMMYPKEDIYCIGFDYYLDRTADNIFLGTRHYRYATDANEANNYFDTRGDRHLWIEMHKRIEEEYDNKIYHVGKHLNYVEFEELLNK